MVAVVDQVRREQHGRGGTTSSARGGPGGQVLLSPARVSSTRQSRWIGGHDSTSS
jgi:hypothetical protein